MIHDPVHYESSLKALQFGILRVIFIFYRNRMFHRLEKIVKSRPKFIDNILYLPKKLIKVETSHLLGQASQLTFRKWTLYSGPFFTITTLCFPILVFLDLGNQPGRQHTRHASFVIFNLIWWLLGGAENTNTILAWPCVEYRGHFFSTLKQKDATDAHRSTLCT